MSKELEYLEFAYRRKRHTTGLLNSIFMTTINAAARTLISVADNPDRWNATDHLRFMVMMMTWFTVWVLRVLMDHFPLSIVSSSSDNAFLGGVTPSQMMALDWRPTPILGSGSGSTALVAAGSSSSVIDLVIGGDGGDEPSVKSLGRALSHVLVLMNEIPATSRKYQFAMSMAERIMEENARSRHVELLQVNRTALTYSFSRTSSQLYTSLQKIHTADEPITAWPIRAVKMLPMGSYVASYIKGVSACVNTVKSLAEVAMGSWQSPKKGQPGVAGYIKYNDEDVSGLADVAVEKLGQELQWVTDKLRVYGAVDEAVVQWSYASGLASLSLSANARVQAILLKISGILMVDLAREDIQVPGQVKFRLLLLWLPLFCHARNGFSFPTLTTFEKLEIERSVNQIISGLPAVDQEVILANWLQDFSVSASEWPNLQPAYDRFCEASRQLVED